MVGGLYDEKEDIVDEEGETKKKVVHKVKDLS